MIETRWLGRISHAEALEIQDATVARVQADPAAETLLLLEHEPVYTIGRTRDQSSLRSTAPLPFPVVETNRGGQATFHGPGQLVGYPILALARRGRDLHVYLRIIEELLIEGLASYRIEATRRDGLTGVWVGPRKIASIGVGVRRWVSMHGFALNIGADLTGFDHITPCGISGVEMTSISREIDREVPVEQAAATFGQTFSIGLARHLPAAAR